MEGTVKGILKKYNLRVWNGLIWHMIGKTSVCGYHGYEHSGWIRGGEILESLKIWRKFAPIS